MFCGLGIDVGVEKDCIGDDYIIDVTFESCGFKKNIPNQATSSKAPSPSIPDHSFDLKKLQASNYDLIVRLEDVEKELADLNLQLHHQSLQLQTERALHAQHRLRWRL